MIKLKDMIGMEFSNWTVIEHSHRTKGRKHVFKCRCKGCHLDFHSKYGYRDNTKEQFEEYYKKVKALIV